MAHDVQNQKIIKIADEACEQSIKQLQILLATQIRDAVDKFEFYGKIVVEVNVDKSKVISAVAHTTERIKVRV